MFCHNPCLQKLVVIIEEIYLEGYRFTPHIKKENCRPGSKRIKISQIVKYPKLL